MIVSAALSLAGCQNASDPATWNQEELDDWFEKKEWTGGWNVEPDQSINRKEFALSYYRNKDRWDKAFAFLKENDLQSLELKRYEIDGVNVYAPVSEYLTKKHEEARYEGHKKYIDIQYVISGKELIGLTPSSDITGMLQEYDEANDIYFCKVGSIKNIPADPGRFFIFFPSDIHRPGLREGDSTLVKKIVVKVKVD